MLPKDGIMLLLIKVLLGFFMIALIIFATIKLALVGFIASVLMAWILNNGIDRYERLKAKQN